jgi:hypothetical protein
MPSESPAIRHAEAISESENTLSMPHKFSAGHGHLLQGRGSAGDRFN